MNGMSESPGAPAHALAGLALLDMTAALGEYFTLRGPAGARLSPLSLLLDDATILDFVRRTRSAIAVSAGCDPASIPVKLAASSFQLGIAARLLSPVVGAAVCFGAVPSLDARSVSWYPTGDHSPRFAATDAVWVATPTPSMAAGVISTSILAGVFAPLNQMLRRLTALSPQVAWGNVISAANGAVTVLAVSRPDRRLPGRALVRALADTDHLAGTATFADGVFSRRSCCLFYQASSSSLCADCVLA